MGVNIERTIQVKCSDEFCSYIEYHIENEEEVFKGHTTCPTCLSKTTRTTLGVTIICECGHQQLYEAYEWANPEEDYKSQDCGRCGKKYSESEEATLEFELDTDDWKEGS